MTNTHTTTKRLRSALSLALACAVAAALSGCRDERFDDPPRQFIPDMDDGPKHKPQSQTEFFPDGRTMRPRVQGTVAFGETMRPDDASRSRFLKDAPDYFKGHDPAGPGKDGAVRYVAYMPPAVLDAVIAHQGDRNITLDRPQAMQALIKRGQERFNIYCSACHGYNGEGSNPTAFTGGLVGRRWGYAVPSFHDVKYLDRAQQTGQDGYIFNVIRNGVPDADPAKPPKMPAYKDKVNEADAWAIVAYVRVLQASWQEDLGKVPADLREGLEKTRPALPPGKPSAGAGGASLDESGSLARGVGSGAEVQR